MIFSISDEEDDLDRDQTINLEQEVEENSTFSDTE